MSLTPEEYVNFRLQKIEDREVQITEEIACSQRRTDDALFVMRNEFAVVKVKLDILFTASGALALGFFGILIDLLFKK